MRAKFDLTFPHQYEVEESQELPSGHTKVKHIYFPDGSERGGQDGLLIKITPHAGGPWLGTFAFGAFPKAVTGIYSCPDEGSVCVVSFGEGYIVKANNPTIWEEVDACPILDVHVIVPKRLLIFADFTAISAYGPKGLAWVTSRLSWDGLKITEATPSYIRGLAWDSPQEREVEFLVDVKTGRHEGGSSPEGYQPSGYQKLTR